MITNASELATQRRITTAFIAADPETIVLIPREQTRTTTGGFVWTELTPRDPQDFKVIERVSGAATNNHVPGGQQHENEFTILGEHDVAIGVHDVFDLRGSRWEVAEVDWDNGYERRAAVIRYGR